MKKKVFALAVVAGLTAGSLFAAGSGLGSGSGSGSGSGHWPGKSGIIVKDNTPVKNNSGINIVPPPQKQVGVGLEFREESGEIFILQNQKVQIIVRDNLIRLPWKILEKLIVGKDDLKVVIKGNSGDDVIIRIPVKILEDGKILNKDNFISIPILGHPDLPSLNKSIITIPIQNNDREILKILISPEKNDDLLVGSVENEG